MSYKTKTYKGHRLIILRKRGSGSRFPFQFGLRKAEMILDNLEEIREFVRDERGIQGEPEE